jgi:hypothetical protein
LGLAHDLMPLQDALNSLLNGFVDHVEQQLRPALIADKKSVADSVWARLDTRRPGMKIKTNMSAGKGVEFRGPEPLPSYSFEVMKFIASEMDYQAGTANLVALTQLQQMPGEDTIERMMEALTPTLRLKGRLLEFFLRDVGDMVKASFFQFYNMPRRVAMLGESGIAFEDFDFDPGTLVPAASQGDEDYAPDLDKSKPRSERAQWFHKQFTFTITPNSLLAISQISRKLMYMQLRQQMLVDRWTLYDVLEVPNGGTPPGGAETITDRLVAEMSMMATVQAAVQGQQMQAMAAAGIMPPPEGSPAGGPSNAGRPPTFDKSPQLEQKIDGGVPRQTISSSGSGGG